MWAFYREGLPVYNLAHFVPMSASENRNVCYIHRRGVSRKLYDCHIILFQPISGYRRLLDQPKRFKGGFLIPRWSKQRNGEWVTILSTKSLKKSASKAATDRGMQTSTSQSSLALIGKPLVVQNKPTCKEGSISRDQSS